MNKITKYENKQLARFLRKEKLLRTFRYNVNNNQYNMWIGGWKGYKRNRITGHMNLMLMAAFVFRDTPQGEPFWNAVNNRWLKFISKQ